MSSSALKNHKSGGMLSSFFEKSLFYVGDAILVFIILCVIFLPFILYGRIKIDKVNLVYVYAVQYAFTAFCIVFGASLSLYVQGKADLIHICLVFVSFLPCFYQSGLM